MINIKSAKEIEYMREAGRITALILNAIEAYEKEKQNEIKNCL